MNHALQTQRYPISTSMIDALVADGVTQDGVKMPLTFQAVRSKAAELPEKNKVPHRNSFAVDDDRAKVGRPFGDGSRGQSLAVIDAILDAARKWVRAGKIGKNGERLTMNMVETLGQLLTTFMDFKTGACEATYEMIEKVTPFKRATIHRHITRLRELGLLNWARRVTLVDGTWVQTSSNYFFEISAAPKEIQSEMRQQLKKRCIVLKEHHDRRGSGPVPNKAQRLVERVAKGLAKMGRVFRTRHERNRLEDDAAFVRAEMALFGDVPTGRWASIRHPGDIDAQEAYNTRLGIRSICPSESQHNDSFSLIRT